MLGADEYATLFETGQYGRLYLVSGSHARGLTFRIFVLPAGEDAVSNGPNNGPRNKDAVEVYGVTGGQAGWTETYGWLHTGRWQDDFERLVSKAKGNRESKIRLKNRLDEKREKAEMKKIADLLASY